MCFDLIFNLLERIQMAIFYFYAKHYFFCFHVLFFALSLWPFFMDGLQMPQGYRATTRREFTFLNLGIQIRFSQNRYTDLKSALDQPLIVELWLCRLCIKINRVLKLLLTKKVHRYGKFYRTALLFFPLTF